MTACPGGAYAIGMTEDTFPDAYGVSPFPPSFEGNPWSYAFGLFGDVISTALALAILLSFILEGRRARQVSRRVNNWLPMQYHPWTPLWLYRMGQMCFLTFVVMRTLPDALWMLAWGEVEQGTIEVMLRLDLILDGLGIIPLVLASLAWAWGRQVIPQKLAQGKLALVGGYPPWDIILKNGRIVLIVSLIALLVALGKASA